MKKEKKHHTTIKRIWSFLHLPAKIVDICTIQCGIDSLVSRWRPTIINVHPGVYTESLSVKPFVVIEKEETHGE